MSITKEMRNVVVVLAYKIISISNEDNKYQLCISNENNKYQLCISNEDNKYRLCINKKDINVLPTMILMTTIVIVLLKK